MANKFRFEYAGGEPKLWVIQKRFLFIFWRNHTKMRYKISNDGTPNIKEVMDYVEMLNKNY